nr:chemokine CCL-CUi [Danio rerio]
MGHCCVYLLVGLLAVTFLQISGIGNNGNNPTECCINYFQRRIPFDRIECYIETRIECRNPGVIFVTKKGLRLCVDPQLKWVNKTIYRIDNGSF